MLVCWQIDHFAMYSEMMGADAGDRMLQRLARVMAEASPAQCICARVEEDLFAHFLPVDKDFPQRLYDCIEAWAARQETQFRIMIHMGVYCAQGAVRQPALFCDRARMALLSVKENFAGRIGCYDDSMRLKMLEQQELLTEMVTAIDTDSFEIYFQPQVDFEKDCLIGAEAVVRWNSARHGQVLPGAFIPLFEKNGCITKLDEYVWERACRYLRQWLDACPEKVLPVSVNISRVDTYHADLCGLLCGLTEKYGVPRSLLLLEITESAFIAGEEHLITLVQRLKEAGFYVEMDDFGSAYSSLNMLKDVPVDALKLDMKFLSGCRADARGESVLSSIVHMAQWLKMPVIAEGVENREQAQYLMNIGCRYMQGYYFAKPMTAGEYEAQMCAAKAGRRDLFEDVDTGLVRQFWRLSAQNARLLNILTNGTILVEKFGEKMDILWADDAFFDRIHSSRERYARYLLDFGRIFSEENQRLFLNMLEQAERSEQQTVCECRMNRPDGIFWTKNRADLLCKNTGSSLFCVHVEDVTGYKQLQ